MEVVEASFFLGGKPGSPLGIESHTENGFPEAKGPMRSFRWLDTRISSSENVTIDS